MNKTARLIFWVILSVFIAGTARAQDVGLTVTGEAGFSDIGGSNDGKTDPYMKYTADASASTYFGIGTIGAALELQFVIDLQEHTSNGNNLGDNFLYVYYATVIGTGELTLALKQSTAFSYWNMEPSIGYSGIGAGFATIDFDLWYDHKFNRKIAATAETATQTPLQNISASQLSLRHPHPDGFDDEGSGSDGGDSSGGGGGASMPSIYGGGGQYSDRFGFNVYFTFNFGLNFQYGFSLGSKNSSGSGIEVAEIVYIDLNYRINDMFQVGLELDDTGKDFNRFTINPYGTFYATENTAFGFNLYFRNINSDTGNIRIGPSIWGMYSF
jgi:hypothetical protein